MWGGGWDSETAILDRLGDLLGPDGAEAFRQEVYARMVAEKDIARIAQMGFNVVRIPLNHRLLEAGPDGGEAPGWQVLDRAIDWCEKYHVYAVLDLHSAPGGQSGFYYVDPEAGPGLWDSEECRARTVALWRAIAARYKNRRIVAGYDLLNEPLPPSGRALVRLYGRIIAAIREVDPDHMIILEGGDFSRDFSRSAARSTPTRRTARTCTRGSATTGRCWFSQYRGLVARDRVPLWCGEFGENSHDMLRTTVLEFEDPANGFSGYCYLVVEEDPQPVARPAGDPGRAVVGRGDGLDLARVARPAADARGGRPGRPRVPRRHRPGRHRRGRRDAGPLAAEGLEHFA